MAKNPNAWQAAFLYVADLRSKTAVFREFSELARPLQSMSRSRWQGGEQTGSREHAMFTFETKKTFSAILCTVLFSATCVLSAVGPAGAVDVRTVSAVSTPLA
jgi:hypothetical protein